MDDLCEGDDIVGLSVSPREKDDLIQVRYFIFHLNFPNSRNEVFIKR